MDADEREIYYYLKSWGREFVSAREIARRAGGKHKFRSTPDWAQPALARMIERKIVESDSAGHYRLKLPDKKSSKRRWASPEIARILLDSGKDFSETINIDDDLDEYFESL